MAIVRLPNYAYFPSFLQEMERMRNQMERVFSGFGGSNPVTEGSGVFPALKVIEDDDKILVNMDLPGVKPEDIEITVEGNTLNLRGERKTNNLPNVSYHRRERAAGTFQKALTLPVEIDADAVEAKCEYGVLKLVLPKAETAKPKKIAVGT